MKQNKQMYVAPKVELIEMQAQGLLCASTPEPADFGGKGLYIQGQDANGAWVL